MVTEKYIELCDGSHIPVKNTKNAIKIAEEKNIESFYIGICYKYDVHRCGMIHHRYIYETQRWDKENNKWIRKKKFRHERFF
jgi:translation initiation factor IF-3